MFPCLFDNVFTSGAEITQNYQDLHLILFPISLFNSKFISNFSDYTIYLMTIITNELSTIVGEIRLSIIDGRLVVVNFSLV